jgi:hypothetical protein
MVKNICIFSDGTGHLLEHARPKRSAQSGPPCDLPPPQRGVTKAAVGKVAQRRSSHGVSPAGQFIARGPWPPLIDARVLARSCRSNNAACSSGSGCLQLLSKRLIRA